MKLTLKNPLKNTLITQKFGENATTIYKDLGLVGHNGLDMRAPDGTPVYASHDGRVTFAGYDGSGGLGVVIRTNEEFDYKDGTAFYKTIYWHLKKDSLLVTGSQQVKAGQQIGLADNTGLSTGSHLHFGLKPMTKGEYNWVWVNYEQNNGYMGAIDPQPFMEVPPVFTKEMKYGDHNDDVVVMQAFFLRLGLMGPIREDEWGWYGKKTAKAVYEFMRNSGRLSTYEQLTWRGMNCGKKTLAELNSKYK